MTAPQPKKRVVSGIRPSGDVHVGNYLGMIRPALELSKNYECIYFIVDLHALTTTKDAALLASQTMDLVATWLALGLDTKESILIRQSDVPQVTELMWYLSTTTGMGLLEKAHAYKDAAANDRETNHGVFAYPVLMAADILIYDADIVPVGKDQKQHVEMARDMAGSFNAIYGEGVLKLPLPQIDERVMTIPGLDGRKMSKSYGNVIPLFCSQNELRKKVMSIKTDSTPLEAPKQLDGSLVGDLYKLFADADKTADLAKRMEAGGLGWGHAKEELFQLLDAHLAQPRARYTELRTNEEFLRAELSRGAERARAIGLPVIDRVRRAVGIR